jgi:hypothetical protein
VINTKEFSDYIVIKPDFTLIGKKSIKKISVYDDLLIRESIEFAAIDSGNGLVEIEQFIDGYDCSFMFWLENGNLTLLLTWDELSNFDDNGDLVSIGLSMPSVAESLGHLDKITKITNEISNNFQSLSALLAFSFRVDKNDKCWLIEIHADITGDEILDKLAPNSSGDDYLRNITRLVLDGNLTEEKSISMLKNHFTPTALISFDKSKNILVKAVSSQELNIKISKLLNSREI